MAWPASCPGSYWAAAVQVVRAIYADGGARAFYRGLMPEYMKVIPGVSIAFCAYEVLKAVLEV